MWFIRTKDQKDNTREIVANGYNARAIAEVLAQLGLPVTIFRVEIYRDYETMRLFVLDERGHRCWVKNEEDFKIKGYSELFRQWRKLSEVKSCESK